MSSLRTEGSYLKARETRRRILDAALGLFLKEGYEKATMRSIARKAGVTPGHPTCLPSSGDLDASPPRTD